MNTSKDTIKRDGKYYFLVEVDEPTQDNYWGFMLQNIDATKNSYEKAVEIIKSWAKEFAEEYLSEHGTIKVRRIGEDAVIAVESGESHGGHLRKKTITRRKIASMSLPLS